MLSALFQALGYLLLTLIAVYAILELTPAATLSDTTCQALYAQQEQGLSNSFSESECTQP